MLEDRNAGKLLSDKATLSKAEPTNKKEAIAHRLRSIVPSKYRYLLIGAVLFALALGLNLYRLGTPSIWFDEAFSVELARQPLPLLWHISFGREPNMELYYLFLHFWLKATAFFGLHPTEFVVRLPSAIFAACSTVFVFALGRRFLGSSAAIVGTILYLLNDIQLTYAQQTRSYSLQLVLLCLAWYALLVVLTDETHPRRWWICYVVATVLAIYAHLFSVLIFLAQCVVVLGLFLLPNQWRDQVRTQRVAFSISVLSIAILSIPMVLVSRQGAMTGWLPVPHVRDLVALFYTISGYSKLYLLALGICCALGVVLVLLARKKQLLPITWSLLCWFALPIAISFVVSQGSTRLFSTRYLVVIVPPLCLLAGLTVTALHNRRIVQAIVAVVMIALALQAVPYYYRSAQVEDWNSTVHWLEQKYQAGDGLVCYDNTVNGPVKEGCQISVEYYLHAYPSQVHFTADTPGAFSWQTYSAPHPEAALDPATLATYSAKHARLFFIVGRVHDEAAAAHVQQTEQWLNTHEHFVGQITTRTVTIRLYAPK